MIRPNRIATCIKLRETLLFAYSAVQVGVKELESDGVKLSDEAIDSLNVLYSEMYMGSAFQEFVSQTLRSVDWGDLPTDQQEPYVVMMNDHLARLQEDVKNRDALLRQARDTVTV